MHILSETQIPQDIIGEILSRDAVLWLTDGVDLPTAAYENVGLLSIIKWRALFIESTDAQLEKYIKDAEEHSQHNAYLGMGHLIFSDPSSITLQRNSKPIFFVNGLEGKSGPEGTALSATGKLRRKLNSIAQLPLLSPRRVLILGENPEEAVELLADLWSTDFRSLITIVSTNFEKKERIKELLEKNTGLQSISWIELGLSDFTKKLTAQIDSLADEKSLQVKIKLPRDTFKDLDLLLVDQAEQSIFDSCDVITKKDLLPVSPSDLSLEEFRAFFSSTDAKWRSYSAGVPWMPDAKAEKQMLSLLSSQLHDGQAYVQIFSIISESGAGGTTLAKTLSYAAAKAGFPTLIIKQLSDVPTALEITNFFYRAITKIEASEGGLIVEEPVWVLVLDVQHATSNSDFDKFCNDLIRSGRKIAIIKVSASTSPLETTSNIKTTELIEKRLDLDDYDASHLGRHLNSFLRNYNKEKTDEEWKRFWNNHKPDIDTGYASFWIALEFWLGGHLELGESINSWILKQFKALDTTTEVKIAILEIAAFSVERKALPERVLGELKSPSLPWSYVLDECRRQAPGLGLIASRHGPSGDVWAVGHDLLARYLINAVWNDRIYSESLGLTQNKDPVELRLNLISSVVTSSNISNPDLIDFVISLAKKTLKLEERTGNPEFFPHWRKVISMLESIPDGIRKTSRAYNHHVSISRRRVTKEDFFSLSVNEKRELLLKTAKDVQFSLDMIDPRPEDESNLNLLNTLALTYQDLAQIEKLDGHDEKLVMFYLDKSDDITERALKEAPNNRYVLETAAKNMLRNLYESSDSSKKIESAARALTYVFQATQLESAVMRRASLGNLAGEALKILKEPGAEYEVDRLCQRNITYGFLAKAWRLLPIDDLRDAPLALESISAETAEVAIAALKESPTRDWLIIRLQYDLEIISSPKSFQSQLLLLDELAGVSGYQLTLQQRLDRAVLLFMEGVPLAAENEFRYLRPKAKESQNPPYVPNRLRWLLNADKTKRAVCTARVIDGSSSTRISARVSELSGANVQFNPREFNKERMGTGEQFKCHVTFSAMGPFLKPVDSFGN